MFSPNFPNIIAMIFALVAMIQLCFAAFKIGGTIGRIFKLLTMGIFFAVFIHAGVELVERFGFIKEEYFLLIMGMLISLGSVFFVIAGFIAIRAFKK
jgi:hypothetical protein